MLEGTHFHTFTMGAIFLILSHLFIATSVRREIKWLVILTTFFPNLFGIGGVWLVRYGSSRFAYLPMASWVTMTIGYLAMILTPLYEMWPGQTRSSQ